MFVGELTVDSANDHYIDGYFRENPRNNSIVQEYILPDFALNRRGRIRQPDEIMEDSYQVLYMDNERFTVPEILFRPDDIGERTFMRGCNT